MKQRVQIISSACALLALLIYTFVHTGALLARYVQPPMIGYVAAFGIETAVVGLSLRIGDMRRARQKGIGFFVFVLLAVVAVSAAANVAEGFQALHGERMTISNVSQLDPLQAVILLAATGLISLIVLALSEIIGTDISSAIRRAEREQRKAEKAEQARLAQSQHKKQEPALKQTVPAFELAQSEAVQTVPASKLAQNQHEQTEFASEPAEQFVCEECGRTFGTVQALNAHGRFCSKQQDANGSDKEATT